MENGIRMEQNVKSRLSGISGAGGCDLVRKEFLPLDITR